MSLRGWLNKISSSRHHSQTPYQLLRALGVLFFVFVVGVWGFWIIGDGKYSLVDCAYMTVITLTTVGFGEVIPVHGNRDAEIFVMGLIVTGMGAFLYVVSSLTAFVVEGEALEMVRRIALDKKISKMRNHYVIAGVGNTGAHVFSEVAGSARDVVVIDSDAEAIHQLFETTGAEVPYLEGDATDDETLISAGIERAAGIIFSLGSDRDNLFAVISARRLNPSAAIVTRGEDPRSEKKFLMAGATSVIYTNVLGGMRMAAEALRPEVTSFLDIMMMDHDHHRTVEELPVPVGSPLVGKKLRELNFRQHFDVLVIAVWDHRDHDYHFNPGPDYELLAESKLIVLTVTEDVDRFERYLLTGEPG